MSYDDTLRKEHQRKFRRYMDSRYRSLVECQTKSELLAMRDEAFRNTAALPLHANGLPHNAGEGEK